MRERERVKACGQFFFFTFWDTVEPPSRRTAEPRHVPVVAAERAGEEHDGWRAGQPHGPRLPPAPTILARPAAEMADHERNGTRRHRCKDYLVGLCVPILFLNDK